MLQQVNLYQPVFRKQHKVFSTIVLVQILGVVLLLLLTLYGHARWSLGKLEKTNTALQKQHQQLIQRIDTLKNTKPTPESTALDKEIEELNLSIESRKILVSSLGNLISQKSDGYASLFEALTQKLIPGLWLTGIRIDDQGAIDLKGKTLNPRLVPDYLQLLSGLPAFTDQRFDSVLLKRNTDEQQEVEFVLHNKTDKAKL